MTELNLNTRTLILCFSLAILALIPLRFVEYGNIQYQQVLGEERRAEPAIELPQLPAAAPGTFLEAPYNRIDVLGVSAERANCLGPGDAASILSDLEERMNVPEIRAEEFDQLNEEYRIVSGSICQ